MLVSGRCKKGFVAFRMFKRCFRFVVAMIYRPETADLHITRVLSDVCVIPPSTALVCSQRFLFRTHRNSVDSMITTYGTCRTPLRCCATSSSATPSRRLQHPAGTHQYSGTAQKLSFVLNMKWIESFMFCNSNHTELYKALNGAGCPIQNNTADQGMICSIMKMKDAKKLRTLLEEEHKNGILLNGPFGRFGGFIKPLTQPQGGQWCVALYHPPLPLKAWESRYVNIVPRHNDLVFSVPMVRSLEGAGDHVTWTAVVFDSLNDLLRHTEELFQLARTVQHLEVPLFVDSLMHLEPTNKDGWQFFTGSESENLNMFYLFAARQIEIQAKLFVATKVPEKEVANERKRNVIRLDDSNRRTVGWVGHRDGMLVAVMNHNVAQNEGFAKSNDVQLYECRNKGYTVIYTPLHKNLDRDCVGTLMERLKQLRNNVRLDVCSYLNRCPLFSHCDNTVRFAKFDSMEVLRPHCEVQQFVERQLTFRAADSKANMDDGTINTNFGRKLLIPGASGTGKTMAALMCLPGLLNVSLLFKGIPIDHTFCFFVNCKHAYEHQSDPDADAQNNCEEEIAKRNTSKILSLCVEKMVSLLETCVMESDVEKSIHFVDHPPATTPTGKAMVINHKILFLIVLDEMGPRQDVVHNIMQSDDMFEMQLRNELRSELTKKCPNDADLISRFIGGTRSRGSADYSRGIVEMSFAVVGTGVGAANVEKGESLPKTYITIRHKNLEADEVFQDRLRSIYAGLHRGKGKPKISYHEEVAKQRATDALNVVRNSEYLCGFLTNARCAAVLAERIGMLCDRTPMLADKFLILNSQATLALMVSMYYIENTGWRSLWAKQDTSLLDAFSCLVHLSVMQPCGYHIVPKEMLHTLRQTVGAIEDRLQFMEESDVDTTAHAAEPYNNEEVNCLFEAAGAIRVIPKAQRYGATWRVATVDGTMRFEVNPAVLLIAIVYKEEIFQQTEEQWSSGSSSIYEQFVGRTVSLQLHAWQYHFIQAKVKPLPATTMIGKLHWKLPLQLLFPYLESDVMVRSEKNREDSHGKTKLQLQHDHSVITLMEDATVPTIHMGHIQDKLPSRVEEKIVTLVEECGTVLTRDGTDRIMLHSKGVVVGIACKKYYTQFVDMKTLRSRA